MSKYDLAAAVEWAVKVHGLTTQYPGDWDAGKGPMNAAGSILAMDAELKQLREDAKAVCGFADSSPWKLSNDLQVRQALRNWREGPPSKNDLDSMTAIARRIFNLPEPPAAEKEGG